MEQQFPVDTIELTGMMIDPDKDNVIQPVNRNNQLGNIRFREVYWCQALEEHALVVENIPNSAGGNIFRKWGQMSRLKKHHFLTLSGSRGGFVRKMERTRIQKNDNETEADNMFASFFKPKNKRKGDF